MKPPLSSPPEPDPIPSLTEAAPAATIDLSSLLDRWRGQDHTAVLLKTNTLRVVFRSLHQGSTLPPHKAAGDITVQVLDGRIEFKAADQTMLLEKGQVMALKAAVPHSLTASQSSAILITLAQRT